MKQVLALDLPRCLRHSERGKQNRAPAKRSHNHGVLGGWGRSFAAEPGTSQGYSVLELMFAAALSVTVGAAAGPLLLAAVDDVRATGAVRYLATRLQQARMEAVGRSADVGVQFVPTADGYAYTVYVDGNGDGVRTRDIVRGLDQPIGSVERLSDHFAGIDFGVLADLPPVDAGSAAPGTDPIKLGSSSILTFTPLGTSSSGSLYLRGRRNLQFVIRILGETGKTRVLKFDSRAHQWKPS
jgi:Type II transport protein GspH